MKKRRKRRAAISVPVASMGDIAFLLIIFFMVASHMVRERHNIKPPRSLDTDKVKETQVTVAIDVLGKIYLQGMEVPSAEDVEAGVRLLLENRTTREQKTVIFRCDRGIRRDTFEPVIEAIARAGGLLAAVGEKGEPVVVENE